MTGQPQPSGNPGEQIMNTEQERADFEAWFQDERGQPARKADGTYSPFASGCWRAWRARAALQSQDAEDAERYRWLLKDCYRWPANGGHCNEFDQSEPVALWVKRKVGDDPCAAIDHARRIEGDGK